MSRPERLVLVGHPVAHSLSPVMQNAALAAANIALTYEALDVEPSALPATLDSLAGQRGAGNVTIPHKEASARLMPRLSPTAERIGAVNTFRTTEDGKLEGHNTDLAGFAALVRLTLGRTPVDSRFAVLGAGGAAAAVLAAIEGWNGCEAVIYSRNSERARKLAERFRDVARGETMRRGEMLKGDIVVNATPIGMKDEELPVPLDCIGRSATVLDLVARSRETAWVRAARESGRVASDGLPMLVEQGAAAFKIWFGVEPDREAMWKAVREATGRV